VSITASHAAAGAANELLAPWGFVDDSMFITKRGDLGLVYAVGGLDYEGRTHEQRALDTHRYESVLRLLDERFRVYHYFVKREGALVQGRKTYRLDLFVVLMYEGLQPPRRGWQLARPEKALSLVAEELDAAMRTLAQMATSVEAQLDIFRLRKLPKAEAFQFFRLLVNGDAGDVRLKYDTGIDYQMADSSIDTEAREAMLVLSMKEPPFATFALMLSDLYALPGEFLACLEWQRIPAGKAKSDVSRRRWHWASKRVPLKPMLDQIDAADTDITVNGHFFGECSLTCVVRGQSAERVAADLAKVLAKHDGVLLTETYNALNAWCSIVPGNHAYNLRRVALLETHCADLAFLFTVDQGAKADAVGRAPVLTLVTQQGMPYDFHLHVQDVGHTVVLGRTGSGKTTLLNAIADGAQPYAPQTFVFDMGHGYRALAAQYGGSVLEFGLDTGIAINPFAFAPTPEHVHFLHDFCRVLLEGQDGWRMDDAADRELYTMVEGIYELDAEVRRLGTLAEMLPLPLKERMRKWTAGGRYGRLFDHVEDTLRLNRFQVFEFDAMREYPALLEPLLFYVLRRVQACVTPAVMTLCVMDEAWRFVTHPVLRDYIQTALKTWRKANGVMVLGTQAVEDFASSDMLRTVVESCPTALLLANPAMDAQQYVSVFGLNDVEVELLRGVRDKGQVLLKRKDMAKVLDVVLDPNAVWLRSPLGEVKELTHA
jgi:type IV secretion/conjugal transfer VirB4 family ATPase